MGHGHRGVKKSTSNCEGTSQLRFQMYVATKKVSSWKTPQEVYPQTSLVSRPILAFKNGMWHLIHEVLLALPIGKRLCIRVWIVTKLCNIYSELHELLQNFVTWSRVHFQNVRRAITGCAACFPLGTAVSTYLDLINYHIESGVTGPDCVTLGSNWAVWCIQLL